MNITDIVLILVLGWAAWKGFSRGFIIEIASLAALVLGIYVAVRYSWVAAEMIQQYVDLEGNTLHLISFCITLGSIVLLVMLIGKLLERVVNLVMLGFINRIGGAIFSTAKVLVIISVLMMILHLVDSNSKTLSQKQKDGSLLYKPIESIGPALLKVFHLSNLILPGKWGEKENAVEEEPSPKNISI